MPTATTRPSHAGWIALAIAIPLATLFGPVLLSDRMFAMRDAGHYYYPLFRWTTSEWAAGRVPLWNPHVNCGTPVLADATSSVFYPGQLVFALPVDFSVRYKLYIVAHVMLAAVAAYLLARHWQTSRCAAALAAISYSCGGSVVFQHANVVYLVGAAWLPLAVLALDSLLRLSRPWAVVGLGVVLALMVLGGDPQAAYHVLLVGLLYWIVLWLANRAKPQPEQEELAGPPRLRFGLAWLSVATAVAFLLAAIQILPSAEATKTSQRAVFDEPRNVYEVAEVGNGLSALVSAPESGTHHAVAYDFSVGPWRLTECVWPNIGGRMFPTHRRWFSLIPAEGRIWTPSLYFGLVPLVLGLSVFRLWRGGDERTKWLSWLVLIFTLGSFGWYGLGWLAREFYVGLLRGDGENLPIGSPVGGVYWFFVTLLPKYVYFRYPAKLLVVAALGISQLAAFGWDRTWAEPPRRLIRVLIVLGGFSGLIAAGAFAASWFVTIGGSAIDPTFGPFDNHGAWNDIVIALGQTAAVSLASAWLLARSKSQAALLLFATAELALANYWLVPTAPAEFWRTPSTAALEVHKAGPKLDYPRVLRAAGSWRPETFAEQGSPQRMAEIVAWERDTLFPKYELLNDLSLVDTYGGLQAADYEMLLSVAEQHGPQLVDGSVVPHPDALRLLGVEWLVLPPGSLPEFADHVGGLVWRMRDPLPRAWIADEWNTISSGPKRKSLSHLESSASFVLFPDGKPRPHRWAAIEISEHLPEFAPVLRDAPNQAERCVIIQSSPQHVVIEATLARPGLVVLSDRYAPGWTARARSADSNLAIEGPVAILRTNLVFRGVWLPAGKHTIEFRYRPASFIRGAWISGVSWSLLAIGCLVAIFHRRKPRPQMQ